MVNRTAEHRFDIAGKGINTSRILTQLGKEVRHLTQLGGALRPFFLELCALDNINIEWVESSSPIRFCYTIIDRVEKTVTELVEEAETVKEGTEERLLEAFSKLIIDCSTLIISGTKAKGFSDRLIPEMVRRAKAENCIVILDIRGNDLLNSLPHKPDLIKPNLFEFISTFRPELDVKEFNNISKDEVQKICSELYAEYRCVIVLTRGKDPIWYTDKGNFTEYTFKTTEPINTIGSGDAFTAGMASSIEDGSSLAEAVAEGARCGALNAALLKPGVIR